MSVQKTRVTDYSFGQPLNAVFPEPIVAIRAPTVTDRAEIGSIWVDTDDELSWILVAINSGESVWLQTGGGGGGAAPLVIGTPGAHENFTNNIFSAAGNIIQIYADTTGAPNGTSLNGVSDNMFVTQGNGTETDTGGSFTIRVRAGGDIANAYGVDAFAQQQDGSTVTSNMFGSYNTVEIDETVAADQPQNSIAGTYSFLSFPAGAAAPTVTQSAAVIADVGLSVALNGVSDGIIVTRSGAAAGAQARSAFRVKTTAAIAQDWTTGLDLRG